MKTNHDFLGEEAAADDEDIVVVTVPVEESTSYIQGTADAPGAILDASRQIELYDISSGTDLEGSGIGTIHSGARTLDELSGFISREKEALRSRFACFVGGEHSITPVILEKMEYGDIGIVWLDAHADMRSEYLGNPKSHACAARNSLPMGRIVEIGVRSASRAEARFIEGCEEVSVFRDWGGDAAAAIDALPERVYVSLDFDSVDPSLIGAVGTPEPGGLTWKDLMDIYDRVFSSKAVVGMDAVELCPRPGDIASSFTAAKAVYEAIVRAAAKGMR
jgi:agmatinase